MLSLPHSAMCGFSLNILTELWKGRGWAVWINVHWRWHLSFVYNCPVKQQSVTKSEKQVVQESRFQKQVVSASKMDTKQMT